MFAEAPARETDHRWPQWVYGEGDEPDYRFTFANERTYLAWVRTALALLAASVAVDAFPLGIPDLVQQALSVVLAVAGVASVVLGWIHWARSERAIRRRRPLPANAWMAIVMLTLAATGVLVAIAVAAV